MQDTKGRVRLEGQDPRQKRKIKFGEHVLRQSGDGFVFPVVPAKAGTQTMWERLPAAMVFDG